MEYQNDWSPHRGAGPSVGPYAKTPNEFPDLTFHKRKVRMVGAAVNRMTPFVGLAGEPVKGVLLKKVYGLNYSEGIASLIVAKTANLISLVIFLAGGLILTNASGHLSQTYQLIINIEAVMELVRACAFFIPAGIGAQEGALVLIIWPITGQPLLGLAVALVRRLREILWIAWGGAIGWRFSGQMGRSNWLSNA
jgi:hypothetical protein